MVSTRPQPTDLRIPPRKGPGVGRRWASLAVVVALAWSARAVDAAQPPIELVYTQPLQTALQQPLRPPTVVWPELLDAAKKRIDIEQFYIAHLAGEALDGVLSALERAARRGVQVRFLVEQKFLKQTQPTLQRIASWPNTQTRVLDWSKLDPKNGRHGGGIIHAKFMVIDGEVGYLGSQNFDWRSLSHVQELGAVVREPRIAAQMQAVFDHDWQAAGLQAASAEVKVLQPSLHQAAQHDQNAYLVASPPEWLPPGVGASEDELVRLIGLARSKLQIQVMKYEPLDHKKQWYAPIDNALRAAAARGVQVELLVSDWNADAPGIQWLQSLSLVPKVAVKMVTIPPHSSGFIAFARVIHGKYMIADGQTLWLGTSNWQGGYFDESRNLELVVRDAALAGQAAAVHAQLWASEYAKPLEACRSYPRVRREEGGGGK
jgi:phosphatidylserine/phosphatidylglycerophosphate/cardiolipin synthase-like enzyme